MQANDAGCTPCRVSAAHARRTPYIAACLLGRRLAASSVCGSPSSGEGPCAVSKRQRLPLAWTHHRLHTPCGMPAPALRRGARRQRRCRRSDSGPTPAQHGTRARRPVRPAPRHSPRARCVTTAIHVCVLPSRTTWRVPSCAGCRRSFACHFAGPSALQQTAAGANSGGDTATHASAPAIAGGGQGVLSTHAPATHWAAGAHAVFPRAHAW